MTCLLPQPYTTTTSGRPRRNLAVSLIKNINSCWSRLTRQATGVKKKLMLNSPKPPTFGNNLRQKKRMNRGFGDDDDDRMVDLDFGDGGGLWQRNILMGDKCQPLAFSGVIYYDNNGKRLSEVPMKSPRASPLPGYYYAA